MFLYSFHQLSSLMTVSMIMCALLCDVTYGANAVNLNTSSGQPEVTLDDGTIVLGLLKKFPTSGFQSTGFLGIPYAVPPTGQMRFQKPVALMSPNGTYFNATNFGPACFSHKPNSAQSEDCLHLNVWVPASESLQLPLAVIVWVHGGGFVMGASSQRPAFWLAAENDVIVVSMNYRLAALGFLSTGDSASVGNYGLWDQHTALLWVQRNIAAFGGDPGAVTLMGQSAGGKSVSFQAISPHSGNLFHRVIMQSGTAHCPTSLMWKPVETALRLGQAVGCSNSSHDALVDCLRGVSAMEVANASGRVWSHDAVRTLIDFSWAPVEDGDFVPQLYETDGTPIPINGSTPFNGSIMIGVNNNEGAALKLWRIPAVAHFVPDIEEKLLKPDFFRDNFLKGILQQMFRSMPADTAFFRTAAEVVAHRFTDWTKTPPAVTKPDLYAMSGDQAYVSPAFQFLSQWIEGRADRHQVYVYVFDNYPEVPADEGMTGMKHEDDVYYTFGHIVGRLKALGTPTSVRTKEHNLGVNFRKLLTNYAKTGNPATPDALSDWPSWPLYNLSSQIYLAISSTPRIATHYRAAYVTLWKDVIRKFPAYQRCPSTPTTCPSSEGNPAAGSSSPRSHTLTCFVALIISAVCTGRSIYT